MSVMDDERWTPPPAVAVLENAALRVEITDAGTGVAGVRVLSARDGYPITNMTRLHREHLGEPGTVAINLDRIAPYPHPASRSVRASSPAADASAPSSLADSLAVVLCSCGRWWQATAADPLAGGGMLCNLPTHRVVAVLGSWDEEPTCAYPDGRDQGEHDHAVCEDAVNERRRELGQSDDTP